MIRIGGPGKASLVLFLVGSTLFYGSNYATGPFFGSWRAAFAIASHPFFNLESITVAMFTTSFFGSLFGPVIARALTGYVPNQSSLGFMLLLVALSYMAGQQTALHSLFWNGKPANFETLLADVSMDQMKKDLAAKDNHSITTWEARAPQPAHRRLDFDNAGSEDDTILDNVEQIDNVEKAPSKMAEYGSEN